MFAWARRSISLSYWDSITSPLDSRLTGNGTSSSENTFLPLLPVLD